MSRQRVSKDSPQGNARSENQAAADGGQEKENIHGKKNKGPVLGSIELLNLADVAKGYPVEDSVVHIHHLGRSYGKLAVLVV